jgi:hypothetical protein
MHDARATLRTDDILSQADIILPSQYFGSLGSGGLSGEQRLMLAVLVDAINVMQSWKGAGSARRRCNFAEAAQWVNARGTTRPFSFDSVCDALEVDSELLRSRLCVFTVRPANSAHRPNLARLRLKELSRSQHLTANRVRRPRHLRPRMMTAMTGRTSEAPSRWEVHEEQIQDCTPETSNGLAAFDEGSTARATGKKVSAGENQHDVDLK